MPSRVAQAWIWALLTAALLLSPGLPDVSVGSWMPHWLRPMADKVVHAGLFWVLVHLVDRAARQSRGPMSALKWTVLLATPWMVALELGQRWIPNREFDLLDICAGALGIVAGAALILAKHR